MDLSREKFIRNVDWPESCLEAFNCLPDVYFWMKNVSSQFMMANYNFLQLSGLKSESEIIGKTDYDFWPSHLAEGYVKDDQKVMKSGENIVNHIELILNPDGSFHWYSTTKIPLYDVQKNLIGVMGFTTDLKKADANMQPVLQMAPVIEAMTSRYMESLEIKELAKLVGLSLSAFERRFKQAFKKTPIQYLSQLRIDAACQLLVNTDCSVSEVAMKTGFYDQSHFSKRFQKIMGKYPGEYRKTHRSIP